MECKRDVLVHSSTVPKMTIQHIETCYDNVLRTSIFLFLGYRRPNVCFWADFFQLLHENLTEH